MKVVILSGVVPSETVAEYESTCNDENKTCLTFEGFNRQESSDKTNVQSSL